MIFLEYLTRLLVAIPLALAGLLLAWKGTNHSQRFYRLDYRGDFRARFSDNLIGYCYYSLAAGFLIAICFVIYGEEVTWKTTLSILPYSFGLPILVLPLAIVGSYLGPIRTNPHGVGGMPKLLDIASVIRGVTWPDNSAVSQPIRISPSEQCRGMLQALLVFAGIFGLTYVLDLSFGVRPGLLFQLALAVIYAAGVYGLTILISRAEVLRRMENDEPAGDKID
jgi:hypothetical protein